MIIIYMLLIFAVIIALFFLSTKLGDHGFYLLEGICKVLLAAIAGLYVIACIVIVIYFFKIVYNI